MVVYVDGKPIFVQNPKLENQLTEDDSIRNVTLLKEQNERKPKKVKTKSIESSNRPKVPYLLAAAAAAAASNHRQQQQLNLQKYQQEGDSHAHKAKTIQIQHELKEDLKDKEYFQLVSLFKQKNEKLFNPMLNKTF